MSLLRFFFNDSNFISVNLPNIFAAIAIEGSTYLPSETAMNRQRTNRSTIPDFILNCVKSMVPSEY